MLQRERQTERQAGRQAGRQAERQTDRQTDRQTTHNTHNHNHRMHANMRVHQGESRVVVSGSYCLKVEDEESSSSSGRIFFLRKGKSRVSAGAAKGSSKCRSRVLARARESRALA